MAGTVRDSLVAMLSKELGEFSPLLPLILNFPGVSEKLFQDPVFDRYTNIPGLGPFGSLNAYTRSAQQDAIFKAFTTSKAGGLSPVDQHYRWALESLTGDKGMADALMRNPVASMAIGMWDPLKIKEAGQVMAKSIITAERMYGGQGRDVLSGSVGYKRALYDMYNGKGGIFASLKESPSSFGDLTYKEVMQVASELMSVEDPLKGVPLTDASKLEANAKKFSEKVKQLSKAIAPLKSVFGEDIPTLFNALEQITGSNQIFQDPTRVRALVNTLQATLDVTGASKEQYMGALEVFSNGLYQNKQDSRAVLGADMLARRYLLGTANSSYMGITGKELQAGAARFLMGTARSQFADDYNAALALYMVEGAKGGVSEKAFREQFDALIAQNYTNTAAFMKILQDAGVQISSPADIRRGQGHASYVRYSREGIGAQVAAEVGMGDIFRNAYNTADAEIRKVLDNLKTPEERAAFIANRYVEGLDPEAARARARAWAHMADVARGTFGFSTMDQWQAYGAQMHRATIMAPLLANRTKLVDLTNSLDVSSGWIGVIAGAQKEGPDKFSVLNAMANFFGGFDPAKVNDAQRRALFAQLSGAFGTSEKDMTAEQRELGNAFMKEFREAIINGTTWSTERFKKFKAIVYDENGKVRNAKDINTNYIAYKRFVDLEPAMEKLRTMLPDDAAYEKAVTALETEYNKKFKKGYAGTSETGEARNVTADFLALKALEKVQDNPEAVKLLKSAIERDKTGTGGGIYSELNEILKTQSDAMAKATRELFDTTLRPLLGGPDTLQKIYELLESFFSGRIRVDMGNSSNAENKTTARAAKGSASGGTPPGTPRTTAG